MSKLVRLKPHDKRRRHVMRVYVHGPTGKKFEERRGWYKVDDGLADYLATVGQIEGDEDAPRAFDVCTAAEAGRIDEREKKVREKRAQSAEANDLTTANLRGEGRRKAADATDAPADRGATKRGAEPKSRARSMRVADATG
jgi:hypothetical protein